jgi:hypothetical protein
VRRLTVTQIHAKQIANAAGSSQMIQCNGTVLTWTVTVQSTNFPMRTGPASATATATGIDIASGKLLDKESTSAGIKLTQ